MEVQWFELEVVSLAIEIINKAIFNVPIIEIELLKLKKKHIYTINLATIFRKILVSLTYGKNRFSYVVRTRAIRFS